MDLKVGFLEHAKVAYELACIHGGDVFARSGRAAPIRAFLHGVATGAIQNDQWELNATGRHLEIAPLGKEQYETLRSFKLHEAHIGIVTETGIIVCMLGLGVMLLGSPPPASCTIYLNDIREQKCQIKVE